MPKHFLITALLSLLLVCPLCGQSEQPKPIGQFAAAADIGDVNGLKGSVTFDVATQTYTLKGSGANVWGKEDAFFFVYVPIDGDFDLSTFQTLLNEGVTDHRKAGIMFRETLDADSACVFITVHGDGLTSLQFREKKAEAMLEDSYAVKDTAAKFISLKREGDIFIAQTGQEKRESGAAKKKEIKIEKKGYLGIFVCSHSTDDYERVSFRNLQFKEEKEVKSQKVKYRFRNRTNIVLDVH